MEPSVISSIFKIFKIFSDVFVYLKNLPKWVLASLLTLLLAIDLALIYCMNHYVLPIEFIFREAIGGRFENANQNSEYLLSGRRCSSNLPADPTGCGDVDHLRREVERLNKLKDRTPCPKCKSTILDGSPSVTSEKTIKETETTQNERKCAGVSSPININISNNEDHPFGENSADLIFHGKKDKSFLFSYTTNSMQKEEEKLAVVGEVIEIPLAECKINAKLLKVNETVECSNVSFIGCAYKYEALLMIYASYSKN